MLEMEYMFEQRRIELVTETVQETVPPVPAPTTFKQILFGFSGRIGRVTYMKYTALYLLLSYLLLVLFTVSANELGASMGFGILALLAGIALAWAVLALLAKRNHDLNYSSLWLVLLLIPIVGFIHPIYLCFAPGTKGENKFGAAP